MNLKAGFGRILNRQKISKFLAGPVYLTGHTASPDQETSDINPDIKEVNYI